MDTSICERYILYIIRRRIRNGEKLSNLDSITSHIESQPSGAGWQQRLVLCDWREINCWTTERKTKRFGMVFDKLAGLD